MINLIRKRLIPAECFPLTDDNICFHSETAIITTWNTFRPKKDFCKGISYYVLNKGWKISRFLTESGETACIYCDIIDVSCDTKTHTYTFTDLLADVIIDNSGNVRVVDLDELAEAFDQKLLSADMMVKALYNLDTLLDVVYSGRLQEYIDFMDGHVKQ